jgi:hypothetical protein
VKIQLLILFFVCTAVSSFGQVSIKGRIKDQRQNLSYATVVLLNPDSSTIKTVSADGDGEFILKTLLPVFT